MHHNYSTITYQVQGSLALLFLNRPESYNSINSKMITELTDFFHFANTDSSVRCILLQGKGGSFCSGQDLQEGVAMLNSSEPNKVKRKLQEEYNPLIKLIQGIAKPIVAGIEGIAAGAGVSLAMACDIILCSKKARFIQSFINIGLVPDSGASFFLPKIVGVKNAAGLMFSGEILSADEAKNIGLVFKVFDETAYKKNVLSFTERISQMPTRSISYIKKLLATSATNTLDQQLAAEAEKQQQASATHDAKEGVNAFLEKRKPTFSGK